MDIPRIQKIKYFSGVALLYGAALLLVLCMATFRQPEVTPPVPLSHGQPIQQAASLPEPKVIIRGKPVRVVVQSVGIDLAINDGLYNESNATWTLSDHMAQYATLTPLLNDEGGNTLIYGHDTKRVFRKLKDMPPQATVDLYTDNGYMFTYTYTSTYVVTPANTTLFDYQGPPIVTLQTCTGAWSEHRQMFTLSFSHYTKVV